MGAVYLNVTVAAASVLVPFAFTAPEVLWVGPSPADADLNVGIEIRGIALRVTTTTAAAAAAATAACMQLAIGATYTTHPIS